MRRNTPRSVRRLRAGERGLCRIEFVVTREQHEALRIVAKRNQQPVAGFIRDAVNEAAAESGERVVFFTTED
jgi:hypothetical protein